MPNVAVGLMFDRILFQERWGASERGDQDPDRDSSSLQDDRLYIDRTRHNRTEVYRNPYGNVDQDIYRPSYPDPRLAEPQPRVGLYGRETGDSYLVVPAVGANKGNCSGTLCSYPKCYAEKGSRVSGKG